MGKSTQTDRLTVWDERFLTLADTVAGWSKDPSTQVGAVIARDKHVVSLGFNGFPKGFRDDHYLYDTREVKYSRIIHAETNAVLNAPGKVGGCTLYCNRPPCSVCSLLIIQAGIRRVVATTPTDKEFMVRWWDSIKQTKRLFEEAGIEYVEVLTEI